ncbi:ornithine cyclodeaminase family protein [Allosphingosinicella indica]|uniref:Ornithine cyclodeaminase n=1 Tax=Allosphingosinicella indica TaxID=941907 RepID=A0A1X7H371_9SPHN|nr:ornithine cyclodeaminase family protein [Allosphingosinicella indica]SMF78140.1 ornithine cyclodeaminase [Allosphingosinicella indica]
MIVIGRDAVARHLPCDTCIALMREAMTALSRGETRQLPRGIVDLAGGRMFGTMPGALAADGVFGAKLISVFPDNFAAGRPSHQGVVALFDPNSGAPLAVLDANELTAIRTAAASAAASDVLARADARTLAILGYGEQAWRHVEAIRTVRPIASVTVWGRDTAKARAFAARVEAELGLAAEYAPSVAEAVAVADIVCAVTAASEPILHGAEVRPGTHVNLVGSGRDGPTEADVVLVAKARFFADHRDSVERQGAELRRAIAAGAVGGDHLLGEIGDVMDGRLAGRVGEEDVTIYKSLGHVVQDLASAWHVYRAALAAGTEPVDF